MIKIKAVGDIMPGGVLNKQNIDFVSKEVLGYLEDADIRIGTLECSIGNEPTFCPIKRGNGSSAFVYAENEDLKRLIDIKIDAVSLANNHFFDLGEIGAINTTNLLKKFGISYFGAGDNLQEAQKPAVFEIKGKTIAFFGFCDTAISHSQIATKTTAGVNPLTESNIVEILKMAKCKYDYVFAVVHWGKEHTWWPRPHVIKYAKLLQKLGISGIIGNHPHRIQSVCNMRGCPVAYSLGNFLFPDRVINTPYVTYYPLDITTINEMKRVYGFTKVSEPSLKLWPDIANVGMILEIDCDEQHNVRMNYELTQISRSGYVDFLVNPNNLLRKLKIYEYIISNFFYQYIVKFCEKISFFKKKYISKFNTSY